MFAIPTLRASSIIPHIVSGTTTTTTTTTTTSGLPAAPNISVTNVETYRFTINWSAVPTATSYKYDVADSIDFTNFYLHNVGATSGVVVSAGIPADTALFIRVFAINGFGTGPASNTVGITTSALPAAPTLSVAGINPTVLEIANTDERQPNWYYVEWYDALEDTWFTEINWTDCSSTTFPFQFEVSADSRPYRAYISIDPIDQNAFSPASNEVIP